MTFVRKINSPELHQNPLYSHAVEVHRLIYLSGQVAMDKEGKAVPGDIQDHTEQCLSNLTHVLNAANSCWDKVVKVNIYLRDMGDFDKMNETYTQIIPEPRPARTCIQAGKLPLDFDIEIEAVAAV